MILSRRSLLALAPWVASAQTKRFARSYFYLQPESKLVLTDFAFGSDRRGWATGGLVREGKSKGVLITTSDGGASWQQTELNFVPVSLFALDDSSIWAVSDRGEIWHSAEAGKDWRKLSRNQNALRVHFLNDKVGFLIGGKKTLMRSEDGGKTWRHVPEAAQVTGSEESFVYRSIEFWNGKLGLVTGHNDVAAQAHRRRREPELPDWMEPETARWKNMKPTVIVSLETRDAGKTWTKQEVSGFGYVRRTTIGADGRGALLVKLPKSADFGGEIFDLDVSGKVKNGLLLRTKDLEIQDILYIAGDGLYVAMTERFGALPVPGKVRVRHSKDFREWTDIAVDYRASAGRITLAATPSGKVFAALDESTILALR